MLKAMVIVCNIMAPNNCIEFTDNRGLHNTEQECKVRVDEIVNDVMPMLPPVPHKFYFKCELVDSV
jgi:hypothetical protein